MYQKNRSKMHQKNRSKKSFSKNKYNAPSFFSTPLPTFLAEVLGEGLGEVLREVLAEVLGEVLAEVLAEVVSLHHTIDTAQAQASRRIFTLSSIALRRENYQLHTHTERHHKNPKINLLGKKLKNFDRFEPIC